MECMGNHRFHGNPGFFGVPMNALGTRGCFPWVPMDPWILMNAKGTHGIHECPWNSFVFVESIGIPGIHGYPWNPCAHNNVMGAHGIHGFPWNAWVFVDSIGTPGIHRYQ
jgi:hypothetical protein